jgi:hypothetical protein
MPRARRNDEWSRPPEQRWTPADSLRETGGLALGGARALLGLLGGALQEIAGFGLGAAELGGRIVLAAGRALASPVRTMLAAAREAIEVAQRAVTPERAVAAVVLCAAALLAASQFVDYRGVSVGTPAYEDVRGVAPPPHTDREPAGSAHAYLLIPVAILAAGAGAFALRGRWRLGRAVSLLGLAGIVVGLLLDARTGLREGMAGLAFEDAHAELIEGFWLQLFSSAVLVIGGVLLARYVRLSGRSVRRRVDRAHRRGESPLGPVEGARA